MRVLVTRRPARVDEGIVQILLNVVNDPLLEVHRIVGEHPSVAGRSLYQPFVGAACRIQKILIQEPDNAILVRL